MSDYLESYLVDSAQFAPSKDTNKDFINGLDLTFSELEVMKRILSNEWNRGMLLGCREHIKDFLYILRCDVVRGKVKPYDIELCSDVREDDDPFQLRAILEGSKVKAEPLPLPAGCA